MKSVFWSVLVAGLLTAPQSTYASEAKNDVSWKMKGKIRADAAQSTTNTKTAGSRSDTLKSSSLTLTRAQFEFVGIKGPVEMRIKYYADKNELKYAFVEYSFTRELSVSAGKLDSRDLSWEWDYSTTDQYIFGSVGRYGVVSVPGAEAKLMIDDQALIFQVVQGATPAGYQVDHSTGGLTCAIQYRGSFMDKMIRPLITYTAVKTASPHLTKNNSDGSVSTYNYGNGYQTHTGIGVKIVAGGANADLEYDTVKLIKQKNVDTSKDENIGSFIAQTRLGPLSDITPYAKLIVDTDKKGAINGEGDVTRTAYAMGAEYAWDGNIRLHGILSQEQSKVVQASGDKNTSQLKLNFGVTASI